ncbi:ABC transporter ATP-binding protein [Longispora urticae]
MTAVIEIEGLRKTYKGVFGGEHRALDGLDLSVAAGQVHGFLGPNGSGKTTTLRTLLGLIRADAGRMVLLGREVPAALPEVMDSIGAIVESPQFFGNFSGRKTLTLLAQAGGVPLSRVDEVLATVGLTDRARDRVKGYSLGMRQRLAVASALLKKPRLLILDEPANGLDPAGIREMRDLMRELASDGVTVVLSSHILGEVQQICDSVTIVAKGRAIVSGPVEHVLASQDRGEYRVRVDQPLLAAEILTEAGAQVDVHDDGFVVRDLVDPSWITRTLAARELYVAELVPLRPDLESVFLTLTDSVDQQVGIR